MGVNSSAFSLEVKSAEFFFYHKLVMFTWICKTAQIALKHQNCRRFEINISKSGHIFQIVL